MERREIIDRIIAVAIAIGLWVYVISVVNPPTTVTIRQVPVSLLNESYLSESKLAIAGDGNYTVDVSLSGKRKDLILKQADLTATADLNGLTPGQNYITVKVTSPSNTTVTEIRTEKIQVYVDELVSSAKPVDVEVLNVPSGYELSSVTLDQDTITVSGAKGLVDMVDSVRVTLDASLMEVDEPVSLQLAAVPVDSEGNTVKAVKLERVFANAGATLYTVKSVPLYTRVDGAPGLGIELLSSSIPSSVSIKGTLLSLAKINYVDAQPLDITGITVNTELPVVPILPDGVELSAGNGVLTASFTLSEQGTIQLEEDSANIALEGLAEGFTAVAAVEPHVIQMKVSGTIDAITDLPEDIISLYMDLSGITEAGEYNLPIQARTLDGRTLTVETDPAELTVFVTAPEPEEEEAL